MNQAVFKIGVFYSVLFFNAASFGQQRELDSLEKKFNYYQSHTLQEKVYVHVSQQFFLTGELLWFKIYVVDGSFHRPLSVSKIAYLDILDKNNVSVLQTKVEIKEGAGAGSIFLPASLNSGSYRLRAYTQWMRNFSPEFYFQQPIAIVNPFIKLDVELTAKDNKPYRADFFPEGGQLVAGIISKVAFKVTDNAGNGINFRGAVINANKDTITTIHPLKFGIGNFLITPQPGEQYAIVINGPDGNVSTYPFPSVQEAGYVLNAVDSGQFINLKVTGRFTQQPAVPAIYLVAHARGIIIKAELKFLHQNAARFLISKKDLPRGTAHFTVFDSDSRPVCERLYFNHTADSLTINVQLDKQYGKRKKVLLTLNTPDLKESQAANLSVSVYKADSLETSTEHDIANYLWLSSDLKGTIEHPEYYFGEGALVKEASDNLMLTHGWRRFAWQDVLNKKPALKFVPEYRGHIIKAQVTNQVGAQNLNVLTFLSVPDKIIRFYNSRSNAEGEVQYETDNFYGRHQLILQSNIGKDSIYSVEIKSPFSTEYTSEPLPFFKLTPSHRDILLSRSIAMQVQDIYNETTFSLFKNTGVDSLAFYGKADATYLLDDYTRFPVMEEVMREYVPGVFVRKRRDGFHFLVADDAHRALFQEDPLILLDGLPIFDADKIMAFDPVKVKKLEVIMRRYYMGPLTFPGVVSYSTYQGDLAGYKLDTRAVSLNYEGLQLQREFYSPQYETPKQQINRTPDKRYLLYWNPDVKTSSKGTQLEFYTSDVKGNFRLVVQGLTNDGLAGSVVSEFSVD